MKGAEYRKGPVEIGQRGRHPGKILEARWLYAPGPETYENVVAFYVTTDDSSRSSCPTGGKMKTRAG